MPPRRRCPAFIIVGERVYNPNIKVNHRFLRFLINFTGYLFCAGNSLSLNFMFLYGAVRFFGLFNSNALLCFFVFEWLLFNFFGYYSRRRWPNNKTKHKQADNKT